MEQSWSEAPERFHVVRLGVSTAYQLLGGRRLQGDASSRFGDEATLCVDEFDEHVAEVLTVGLMRGPTGSES